MNKFVRRYPRWLDPTYGPGTPVQGAWFTPMSIEVPVGVWNAQTRLQSEFRAPDTLRLGSQAVRDTTYSVRLENVETGEEQRVVLAHETTYTWRLPRILRIISPSQSPHHWAIYHVNLPL